MLPGKLSLISGWKRGYKRGVTNNTTPNGRDTPGIAGNLRKAKSDFHLLLFGAFNERRILWNFLSCPNIRRLSADKLLEQQFQFAQSFAYVNRAWLFLNIRLT